MVTEQRESFYKRGCIRLIESNPPTDGASICLSNGQYESVPLHVKRLQARLTTLLNLSLRSSTGMNFNKKR